MYSIVASVILLAAASGKDLCEVKTYGGDARDYTCALESAAQARRFRFKANFSGGHDDTKASMKTHLNGEPIACETGSKTYLFGEEGDVSLECQFSIAAGAGTKSLFFVELRWSHAQYTDFELDEL